MGSEPVGKLLLKFSLPGVIAMLVQATYNMVDRVFVGGLGHDALASLTVVFPIQMLFLALGSGIGIGTSSLISRRLGEKRPDDANLAVGQALGTSLVLGILSALFGYFFGYPLLKLMGATNEILADSFAYFSIIILGTVFSLVNMVSANVVRAEGNPTIPMITMISSAVLNVALDPIFIYALKMGVSGAALATVISQVVASAILLSYLFGRKTEYKIKSPHFVPNFGILGEIFKIGTPQMLMLLLGSVTMAFTIKVVSQLGTIVIATFGVYASILQFGTMPCVGISGGAMPIIGYNYGAKSLSRVRSTFFRALIACTAITALVGLSAIIFPAGLASIFNRSVDFLAYAGPALRIGFMMFILEGSFFAFSSYFQGTGQALPSVVLGIISRVLTPPAVLLLVSLKNPLSIWYAIPVIEVLLFILYAIWVFTSMKRRGIWSKDKIEEISLSESDEFALESVGLEERNDKVLVPLKEE
jgi:putative MATE family efflux protein